MGNIKSKLANELKTFVVLFVYLALLLTGFTIYKGLILHESRVSFFLYSYNLVEALVLAKVIMIGRLLHLGNKYGDRRLIVPALYKTLCFSAFVYVFSVLERVVSGILHGKSAAEAFHHLMSNGMDAILTQTVVVFIAFVPLFAFWEVGEAIGEERPFALLLKPRKVLREDLVRTFSSREK